MPADLPAANHLAATMLAAFHRIEESRLVSWSVKRYLLSLSAFRDLPTAYDGLEKNAVEFNWSCMKHCTADPAQRNRRTRTVLARVYGSARFPPVHPYWRQSGVNHRPSMAAALHRVSPFVSMLTGNGSHSCLRDELSGDQSQPGTRLVSFHSRRNSGEPETRRSNQTSGYRIGAALWPSLRVAA